MGREYFRIPPEMGNDSSMQHILIHDNTGLPSSVCVVGCAFKMAVSVYQISKTKAEI